MKIARLDTLPRQDSLFTDGEPDGRYKKRQFIVVEDGYDFVANNATDVTNISNLRFMYSNFSINYNDYRNCLISVSSGQTFSGFTLDEQEELAKNFAVGKTERDSVFSSDILKEYYKEVRESINESEYNNSYTALTENLGIPTVSDLSSNASVVMSGMWSSGSDKSNLTNDYIERSGEVKTDKSPFIAPFDMTIVAVATSSDKSQTWNAEIRKSQSNDDSFSAIYTLGVSSSMQGEANNLSIDISKGDRIATYIAGTSIDYPNIDIYWKSR